MVSVNQKLGGRSAGLFCFRIYCEGVVQCWLGLQVSLHEDFPTGFQSLQSTDPSGSANAISVLACPLYFLHILLVTQGNLQDGTAHISGGEGYWRSSWRLYSRIHYCCLEFHMPSLEAISPLRFLQGLFYVVAILQFHIIYLGGDMLCFLHL